jgi:hypothetical protein
VLFVTVVTGALRNLGRAVAGSSNGPPYDGQGRRRKSGDDPCLCQKAPSGLLATVRMLSSKPRDLPKISKIFRVLTTICLDFG